MCLGRGVTVTELKLKMNTEDDRAEWLELFTRLTQPASPSTAASHWIRQDDAPTLLLPDDAAASFSQLVPTWLALRVEHLDAIFAFCAPYYAPIRGRIVRDIGRRGGSGANSNRQQARFSMGKERGPRSVGVKPLLSTPEDFGQSRHGGQLHLSEPSKVPLVK